MLAVQRNLKAKIQQLQGSAQQQAGYGLKGGIQKIRGKINEFIAEVELSRNKHNPRF